MPCDAADESLGLVVGRDQRRDVRARVELDGHGAADAGSNGVPDDSLSKNVYVVVAERLGVVLPGEDLAGVVEHLARGRLQLEARVLAAELPDDLARWCGSTL